MTAITYEEDQTIDMQMVATFAAKAATLPLATVRQAAVQLSRQARSTEHVASSGRWVSKATERAMLGVLQARLA